MRARLVSIAFPILLVVFSANRAAAETITLSFGFVASGFGVGAPVDPVTGSFRITFDNSTDLREQTTGISANLNINLDSAPVFAYGSVADVLVLGSLRNGAQTLAPATNDFLLGILNVSTNPIPAGEFTYSQAFHEAVFEGPVTLTQTPIPEPGTLTLLGSGAAIALARRRRRPLR
jgi:hypothetical protein